MYNKVDASLNFVEREKQVLKFWEENDIFQKSMDSRKEGETYTFYDGPPTANGKPHIGHVETRAIKDMIPRYQTMKGKFVPRKAGWESTEWSLSLRNVRNLFGNIRECGRISQAQLVSGLIWTILTSHMMTISSSLSGGHLRQSGTRSSFTRDSKSFLIAHVAVLHFQHRRLLRATRLLRSAQQSLVSKSRVRMHTSLLGQLHLGHFHLTLHSALIQ